jgi:hypothetical protein
MPYWVLLQRIRDYYTPNVHIPLLVRVCPSEGRKLIQISVVEARPVLPCRFVSSPARCPQSNTPTHFAASISSANVAVRDNDEYQLVSRVLLAEAGQDCQTGATLTT